MTFQEKKNHKTFLKLYSSFLHIFSLQHLQLPFFTHISDQGLLPQIQRQQKKGFPSRDPIDNAYG